MKGLIIYNMTKIEADNLIKSIRKRSRKITIISEKQKDNRYTVDITRNE